MLDRNGFISEATTTNLFIVKDNEFFTPHLSAGVLQGVTRNRIIELVRELGYNIFETTLTPYAVTNADEAFLTGTLGEILPLVRVKGIEIGDGKPGAMTKRIMEEFIKIRADPTEGLPVYQEAQKTISRM
jgi:branched-chain amino acid aminotransferase